ncbi:hypothetical protein EWU23_07150 [Cytophagaceae bacterium 50C-KIRBA]|uniref:Uncharacterized protein n=1 Tax=Aquirufa beregesia TaxID=2516556 RepID=A0ABX0EW00_9BACT|nr:hypothetical protein [Aquirufa beregesia]
MSNSDNTQRQHGKFGNRIVRMSYQAIRLKFIQTKRMMQKAWKSFRRNLQKKYGEMRQFLANNRTHDIYFSG